MNGLFYHNFHRIYLYWILEVLGYFAPWNFGEILSYSSDGLRVLRAVLAFLPSLVRSYPSRMLQLVLTPG